MTITFIFTLSLLLSLLQESLRSSGLARTLWHESAG